MGAMKDSQRDPHRLARGNFDKGEEARRHEDCECISICSRQGRELKKNGED